MGWNYRVLRSVDADGEFIFALHEVYYESDGKIAGWTAPVDLDGYESVLALVEAVGMMLADAQLALRRRSRSHSVLNVDDLEAQSKEANA